jgi:hypothetical protein
MTDFNPVSPTSLDEALNKQDLYAKIRLVHALEYQITNLIPEVISNLANSCLTHCTWLDEEAAQIRKIVSVLGSIHELRIKLETLSQPLINIYSKLSLSPPTWEQNPTGISGGVQPTSKQASSQHPDDCPLPKPTGAQD